MLIITIFNMITILGKLHDNYIDSNAGQIKVCNGHLYQNIYGYWLLIERDGKYYIKDYNP